MQFSVIDNGILPHEILPQENKGIEKSYLHLLLNCTKSDTVHISEGTEEQVKTLGLKSGLTLRSKERMQQKEMQDR